MPKRARGTSGIVHVFVVFCEPGLVEPACVAAWSIVWPREVLGHDLAMELGLEPLSAPG